MPDKRLVHTEGGHNKYYEMTESFDGKAMITYGRMGTSGTTIQKPMSYWNHKYKEKLAKGYRDVSDKKGMSLEEIFANLDKLEAKFL